MSFCLITHVVKLYEDGEWAILEWGGRSTSYHEPGSEGKPFKLKDCGFFQIIDAKIKFQIGFFDKHTWFKQVDLPLD